jgi:hypothetical protein
MGSYLLENSTALASRNLSGFFYDESSSSVGTFALDVAASNHPLDVRAGLAVIGLLSEFLLGIALVLRDLGRQAATRVIVRH